MLLIDGDILAYKVSAACEAPVYWGDDLWTLHADAKEGRAQVDEWLNRLDDDLENRTGMSVYLSSQTNYRMDVYAEYKANRKDKRKPMILKPMRDYLTDKWAAKQIPDLEADDLIGMEATRPGGADIIVSIDKDFKTVPCLLYNPDKPELGIQRITHSEADYWFMYQTLCGDATDNYSGCPGVGPKKAEALLKGCEGVKEMWSVVVKAFDKAGLSSKHALTPVSYTHLTLPTNREV